MEDLIKRADAIKAIVNTPSNIADVMGNNFCLDGAAFRQNEIIDILKDIPSAEKQGEWIYEVTKSQNHERGMWVIERIELYCSECKREAVKMTKFCPNCGADMRGADDE